MVGPDNLRWTGEMGARGPAASAAGPPSAQGTVAMAKIQSEVIVAIIAALVAVAVWRVARNPQLAVLAIAMLYVVARSVIARALQEEGGTFSLSPQRYLIATFLSST